MKITIFVLGSRGDIQPHIALGQGLKQAGHTVKLAAPENFQSFALAHGLDFFSIAPDSQAIMAGELGQRMMTSGENGPAFLHYLAEMVSSYADECLAASLKACEQTDAVLFNVFALMGFHVAEALNLPMAGAWVQPLHRTRQYPSLGTPAFLSTGGVLVNGLSYRVNELIVQHTFRNIFGKWRKTLRLPPLPISGFYDYTYQRKLPVMYGYSPTVHPRPADWPEQCAVTGYWFLDHPEGFVPPAGLVEFLEAGPAPVYIGFGSVVGAETARLTETVLGAARQSRQRVVLSRGWGGLEAGTASQQIEKNIFVVDNIPHDWLFPQMAAVVHHGGAGTAPAALRAGVPAVIVPFAADQPFWGERVHALGVGPTPILHTRLTVDRLAAAMTSAASDKSMKARARAIGEKIRAEDGIARAVQAFERWVG